MHILLTMADLYLTTGGGQTVTRTIIEQSPDIVFTYLRLNEPETLNRPVNCRTVPLSPRLHLRPQTPPPHPRYEWQAIEEADAIARSVAGQTFDIVETPDFCCYAWALPAACAYHNIKVGRFVLSMHGNLSKSIELNWGSDGDHTLELQLLERRQFTSADGIYSLSPRYMAEWQAIIPRDITYIDPLHFVKAERPTAPWRPSGLPSLYCVGRSERRKGNDLFIELCRWLPQKSYRKAEHIGACDVSKGIRSDDRLKAIARMREIEIPHLPSQTHATLLDVYREPSIVILPTRYDTLNLVALEALFSGCPLAVSTHTGVCDYLDQHHPDIPYLKLDLDHFHSNIKGLRDLIKHYDHHRARLHDILRQRQNALTPLNMKDVYSQFLNTPRPPHHDPFMLDRGRSCRNDVKSTLPIPYLDDSLSLKRRALHFVRRTAPQSVKQALRPIITAPRDRIMALLRDSGHLGDARYFASLRDAQTVPQRLRDIGSRSERNRDALKEKLGTVYFHANHPLYRCNFWAEIARIERLRGQDLMAATYELRIMRLLGDDRLGFLPRLTETLRDNKFPLEAEAVQALYGDPRQAPDQVYALLKKRFHSLLTYQPRDWHIIDDRRHGEAKVAVIVSLYKAANKLHTFLTALAQQSLVRSGQVEIILVDSGSPTDERSVFEAFHANHKSSMVYARSAERETIQAAWNRGIALSRAPYLVFLGVDETIYPETIGLLATELDQNPDVDWVMGHSLVTSVEDNGLYKHDIMAYDRKGATKDHVYLETCYLSWVGGIYRRSIHDRFGYYDETFRGAGDTEFKNRILPYIKVKFIDKMLGVFLNYPEGQTTASPMAEIEDSRAWYLFRSAGGVRYAFEERPITDAEALLKLCLGYRKSYCGHISTDIDYATLLADYIVERESNAALAQHLSQGLHALLTQLRTLELANVPPSRFDAVKTMARAWRTARQIQADHARCIAADEDINPHYQIMNDNRYEQHAWLWKSI